MTLSEVQESKVDPANIVAREHIMEAANRLMEAAKTGIPSRPVRDLLPQGSVEAAYAVQEVVTEHGLAAGRRLIGRKIGLTSKSVQRQIGVEQPDYGMLFANFWINDGDTIAPSRLISPRVEAEVAFVIERPLDDPELTVSDVVRSIAYIVPAIEVVDTRIANWDIGIVDTVADNASSGLFVLGNEPKKFGSFDLRLAGMVMEKNGEALSFGAGAACLGHPLHAVMWLAKKMVEVGRPLGPGDLVLSGALGPMLAAKPGDWFETRVSGLGSVRVAFEAN